MRRPVALLLVASGMALGGLGTAAAFALVQPGRDAATARGSVSPAQTAAEAGTAAPSKRGQRPERAAREPEPSTDTPYGLVAEIAEAEQAEPGRLAAALGEVRTRWRGRRYTWEARVVPALCAAPARCAVLALDHARLEQPAAHGWLPRLALEPDAHRALERACAPHDRCVVRFEGTLAELGLSPDLPTALTFEDVDILAGREAREGEAWARQRRQPAR